jgi:hypothetical protein
MPKLRHAALWSPLRWDINDFASDEDGIDHSEFEYFEPPESWMHDYLAWGLKYCVPGEKSVTDQSPCRVNVECRQIQWHTGAWRPDPELHSIYRDIGRQQHGEAFKERFDDDSYGYGLVDRDCSQMINSSPLK